jgi:hypothetical protein
MLACNVFKAQEASETVCMDNRDYEIIPLDLT